MFYYKRQMKCGLSYIIHGHRLENVIHFALLFPGTLTSSYCVIDSNLCLSSIISSLNSKDYVNLII